MGFCCALAGEGTACWIVMAMVVGRGLPRLPPDDDIGVVAADGLLPAVRGTVCGLENMKCSRGPVLTAGFVEH
jgi:hypothetical protein